MNGSDTDEIIKELFKSLLQRYQENLQEKMKGSDFAFDGVNYLYYDLNKISISKGGSYIDFPKWLKDKKSTINLIEEYNWKDTDFPSTSKDWKKFELNTEVALNILYVNTKIILLIILKKNRNRL